MSNVLNHTLFSNLANLRHRTIFLVLFVISLFIRLPFFFRDYIDRDESTFILIGQSWVDGFLPYTELWDIKPPLTFLFFAGIISLFGKSFIAIRLAGTLLVTLTAFFTYKIGTSISTKKVAIGSAIACVLLQSLFGSIQGVMSEHLCMAFLTPAIYLILRNKEWYWLGLAGLLMGISIMVKLNMAYTILFLGIYLIHYFIRGKEYVRGFWGVTAYGLGIIAIILLTLVPYYLQGLQELWWKSVVIAPLDYAGARRYSIFKLLPHFIILAAFFFFAWKKKYLDFTNTSIQVLLVAILGVLYSFFQGGRINSHYLIQLHPILIVLVAIVISKLPLFKRLKWHQGYLFLILLIPMESYLEYYNILKHKIERGSFFNGEGMTAPQYILENNIATENILFTEYHIGYWMLGENPPTKAATHPSNICKPEMFAAYDNPRKTAMEELRYIMEELKPSTVVSRKNRLFFDKKQLEANAFLKAYLEKHYALRKTIDQADIYTRL